MLVFIVLSVVMLIGAVGVVTLRQPVHAALSLVGTLLTLAIAYVQLHAHFLAAIQVIVYAGAIMVLFLFVIMLLNLSALPELEDIEWSSIGGFVVGIVLLSQLLYVVALQFELGVDPVAAETAAEVGSAATLGEILFTRYALHLQVAGILLLAATVGAVLLAQRRFE